MQLEPLKLSIPALPFDKLSFLLNVPILLIIFAIFFVFYAIVSIVLFYHWSEYGMRHAGIYLAEAIFMVVSVLLFVVAGLALHYF